MYWNHNSAYYPWIKEKTGHCQTILDAGCGDGTLVFFLNDGEKRITGIDPDAQSIKKAAAAKTGENLCFICAGLRTSRRTQRMTQYCFQRRSIIWT